MALWVQVEEIRLYSMLKLYQILSSCMAIIMVQKSAKIRVLNFFLPFYHRISRIYVKWKGIHQGPEIYLNWTEHWGTF